MKKIRLSITSLLLIVTSAVSAQNITIRGIITSKEDGIPVDFATIALSPSYIYAMSEHDGKFELKDVPAGKMTMIITCFGMEDYDTTFVANSGKTYFFDVKMRPTSLKLDEVVVTARQNKAGNSTASNISRQAMDHMQTSSLKDIMALLPGMEITNPTLSSAQNITIRTAGSAGASSAMNSLGTAIIVDGAPISNNSNLQVLNPVQTGDTYNQSGGTQVSTGIDVRSLSTDNIESIEVIRGIPSVEYGDITQGAVLVKSKAGKSPYTIRFKTNPNIYQVSVAKGFSLGKKGGNLNISGDYAYSTSSLTKSFAFYQRANIKALWSIRSGIVNENTSLTLSDGRDTHKLNPDELNTKTQSRADELGIQFNTNGKAMINMGWLRDINWLVSGSYNNKVSHYENMAFNAMNLYSTAMQDGLIYTNVPGMNIVDIDGMPITNITDETSDIKGTVLPYSYFYMYDIFGKELNVFAKINANIGKIWNNISERLFIGVDFKSDGNLGKGAVYDDEFPPWRNIGNASSGYRKRPYYDIPFINQLGVYAENYFKWNFADRDLSLTAGLRFELINGKTAFAPRINASIDIFPNIMTLRGGWGINTKAPTSIYLYPNKAYQDIINYNGMSVNTPESERLLVATTNVYDASNPDLEIARNRKAEIGFDFKIAKKYRISITGYDELMNNGYDFGLNLSSFIWFQNRQYKVAKENPGTYPTLELDNIYNQFFEIYKPCNNIVARNSGIEYEIDLGRFEAIRTSFYINGAWMRSSTTNKGYSFSTRAKSNDYERNIGVYAPKRVTSFVEKINTTFKITHNIPAIGFVITLTGQINWMTKFWNEYYNEEMFVKYISRKDGQVYDFNPEWKDDPEFSYLFPTLNDNRFVVEQYFPTIFFNLNLSKEIGDFLTASFYVNNIFNQRPLYKNKATGNNTELGIPIFFGFEFKVTIK